MSDCAVVVDCGSHTIKAGLSGHERPFVAVPAPLSLDDEFWQELSQQRPFLAAKEQPFLLGVPLTTSRNVRDTLCQVILEQINAPSLYIASTPFLSVLGAGLNTALVLDVGQAGAFAVPVDDGLPLPHCASLGGPGGEFL